MSAVDVMPIADWPGYWAGADGRIYSDRKRTEIPGKGGCSFVLDPNARHELAQCIGSVGYPVVTFVDGELRYQRLVHTLVLSAWRGPRPQGMQCRHLDGNRSNSALSNLAWGTAAENAADKVRHGTIRPRNYRRLTIAEARAIRADAAREKVADLARRYGTSVYVVRDVINGKTWRDDMSKHDPNAQPPAGA